MQRRTGLALLPLLALAAAGPVRARAEGDEAPRGGLEVEARAALRLRYAWTEALPRPIVRFDPARVSFDLGRYLRAGEAEASPSGLASLRVEGRAFDGDLRLVLAGDTGELRQARAPEPVHVCSTTLAGGGIALAGSARCFGRLIYALESTEPGAVETRSNGRPVDEEARATAFLREAYAALSFGRAGFVTLRAGRARTIVGDGFVYDDYATGVDLRADLGAVGTPLDLAVALFAPTRDFPESVRGISPMLALRLDWTPSLFEHVGVFAAGLRDRTGSAGELLRATISERLVGALVTGEGSSAEGATRRLGLAQGAEIASDARLGFLGTTGSLSPWRGHRLGFTAAVSGGKIREVRALLPRTNRAELVLAQDVALSGRLGSVQWEADVGRAASLGAFVLYQSGGAPPARTKLSEAISGSYHGFLGIAPFVTVTNLFFGGGLSESFAARQLSAPGVNGRGVFAPGASLTVEPGGGWTARVKGAWLRADVEGPFGGYGYGTEGDVELTWAPVAWVRLGAELDVLVPGDFFVDARTMYKALVAVDLVTP